MKRKHKDCTEIWPKKTNCLWEKTKKKSEAIQLESRRPNNEGIKKKKKTHKQWEKRRQKKKQWK